MKYLASLITCLLVGCSTPVPVTQKFPDVPKELLQSCPKLNIIEGDTIELSEFLKIVTDNYTNYHTCEVINKSWIEWYDSQKQIFGTVK
jgi:hypothetical protein